VQVQRWLGHHKPSFTLDIYVHLMEEDIPEPVRVAQGKGDVAQSVTQPASEAEAASG
jgi:hypothetical protein